MIIDNKLAKKIEHARLKGKKIGLVQGSWDLFHIGHLKYIKKAKELCDFLVIGMDSDEKIRARKGSGRPIITEEERYAFIKELNIASGIVIKQLNEPKWGLIKELKPDVLIVIKENYTNEQLEQLKEFVGEVVVLPRQSRGSTSDVIRNVIISSNKSTINNLEEKLNQSIEEFKKRNMKCLDMPKPIPALIEYLTASTDWVCPVAAACFCKGKWFYGANESDFSIPKFDVENRTELYYATVKHAEIDLLKKIGNLEIIDFPIYVTLFPCDKCMKVLIDKGIKKIYYIEDHPDKNWSKRSHELATKNKVETICLLNENGEINDK